MNWNRYKTKTWNRIEHLRPTDPVSQAMDPACVERYYTVWTNYRTGNRWIEYDIPKRRPMIKRRHSHRNGLEYKKPMYPEVGDV